LDFNLNAFNQLNFIFVFFLVYFLSGRSIFSKELINFLIALGILQVIVSYLQVNQIIPPASKDMSIIEGQSFIWVAGLDDVASGTFGAAASNVTSWFCTILFLFLFALGNITKKKWLMFLGILIVLQHGSVDSKTISALSIISFFYLLQKLKVYNVFNKKNVMYLVLVLFSGIILSLLLKTYYLKLYKEGVGEPKKLITDTAYIVYENFWNWGKFAGFKNITVDHLNNNPYQILFGYGRENYNYSDNMSRIESMDTPIMQLNNITRSRSAFIDIYAKLGLFALLLILYLFKILFMDINKRHYLTPLGLAFKYSASAMLIGSLILMFLYGGHTYNDPAFMTFFILYALVLRTENEYKKQITTQKE
jgi:hypothetical protein